MWIISVLIIVLQFVVNTVEVPQSFTKQPNVIFVFADDQCSNSLSMKGDAVIQTLTIDKLVLI
ncbi:hypothetical protein [Mangrovibacterium sp.]|uniref:hypothetical protein n=1 Tax=Mangrovibacterium sp. TaxID=1961364 RepID=UPI003562F8A0